VAGKRIAAVPTRKPSAKPRAPPKRAANAPVVRPAPPPAEAPATPPPVEPAAPKPRRIEEPVWLVRVVLLLFLVGFAAFLAREVYNFLHSF